MSRFPGKVLWTVAAVAIVVAMAQVADAQRQGGRGRGGRGGFGGGPGFGVSPVQLVAQSEEVQDALKLTDEQKEKVKDINDKVREELRSTFDQGGGDFRANMEKRQKLNQEASAKLADVLDEGQQKRLMGIQVQVNGANSLFDDDVAKELNITEDQKSKLAEARDENRDAMREKFQDLRDQNLSREEMMAKVSELRTDSDKKLLAVLTSDQQDQYEALKGEKVDVDMSQFRGGFGGGRGFGDGQGGGRQRGARAGRRGANRNNNDNGGNDNGA